MLRSELDLSGYVLLPAPAEPYAHLDKALTAARVQVQAGDLGAAIEAWHEHRRGSPSRTSPAAPSVPLRSHSREEPRRFAPTWT